MNMKLKALAAAVLMAVGGQAAAATAGTQSGNGELILNIWDTVAQTSFVMDLSPVAGSQFGTFHMNDFLPVGAVAGGIEAGTGLPGPYTVAPGGAEELGLNMNWSMSGTAWDTFLANVAAGSSDSSNWRWNVFTGDSTGATGISHQYRAMFTSQGGFTAATTQVTNIGLLNDIFAGVSNNDLSQADNAATYVTGDALYYPAIVNENLRSVITGSSMANVGESMNFYYLTGGGVSGRITNPPLVIEYANGATWSFDGETLNYATSAVPVPAAVWLLGSALIGLVGVARRRELTA